MNLQKETCIANVTVQTNLPQDISIVPKYSIATIISEDIRHICGSSHPIDRGANICYILVFQPDGNLVFSILKSENQASI